MDSTTEHALTSSTQTALTRPGNSIGTDATNFFIIACTILGAFGLCTGLCCVNLRYRKQRMQRIITAAFQQGIFQHAEVGERVNALRRGVPVVEVKKEISKRPQLYEIYQHEDTERQTTSGHDRFISQPPKGWSQYTPISASITLPDAVHLRISEFPVDIQLAYLFHAKLQLRREWKQSARPRGSVPPYVLKKGETPQPILHTDPNALHKQPILRFSVLIAMPEPPSAPGRPSSPIPNPVQGDTALGIATTYCDDVDFDSDDDKEDKPDVSQPK